jgi:heme/copper-type cytochrome/quinol oxidase subunit 2
MRKVQGDPPKREENMTLLEIYLWGAGIFFVAMCLGSFIGLVQVRAPIGFSIVWNIMSWIVFALFTLVWPLVVFLSIMGLARKATRDRAPISIGKWYSA